MNATGRLVVFGGSSGIGRAVALAAAAAGAPVLAVGRDQARLAALSAQAGGITWACADIRDSEAVAQALAGVEIGHVVVAAGTVSATPVLSSDPAALRAPFDERVFGAMHVVRAAAPRMSCGSFLFVTGDLVARPVAGLSAVVAAAAAVEALARTWVLELAPLRFNILSPGSIDTPLHDKLFGADKAAALSGQAERIPLKRVGRSEEVAHVALAMISNPFLNGARLDIDGGLHLA